MLYFVSLLHVGFFLPNAVLALSIATPPNPPPPAQSFNPVSSSLMASNLLTSANNSIPETNTTTDLSAPPTCFNQHSTHLPQLYPILIADCYQVFYEFIKSSRAQDSAEWDASATTFPILTTYGSCGVRLGNKHQDSRDVFSRLLITNAAAVVAERYIRLVSQPELMLGGSVDVGPRKKFLVAVYGVERRGGGGGGGVLEGVGGNGTKSA